MKNLFILDWDAMLKQPVPASSLFWKTGAKALLSRLGRNLDISVVLISERNQLALEWEIDESGAAQLCEIEKVVGLSKFLTDSEMLVEEALYGHVAKEAILIADRKYAEAVEKAGIEFQEASEETFRRLYAELANL